MISMVFVVNKLWWTRLFIFVGEVQNFFVLSRKSIIDRCSFRSLRHGTFFYIFPIRGCSFTTHWVSSQKVIMCSKCHRFIYESCLCLTYFCLNQVRRLNSKTWKWDFSPRKNGSYRRGILLTWSTILFPYLRFINFLTHQ